MKIVIMAAAAVAATAAWAKEVKVSSFGYDPEDSTRFLQAALDSGADRVIVDRQKDPWISKPLFGRSNTEIVSIQSTNSAIFPSSLISSLMGFLCS